MNMSRVKLLEDHPGHYVLHDGKAPFRVPKAGLSKEMHARIQRLAGGGEVRQLTDVMHSRVPLETPDEYEARKRAEAEEEGDVYVPKAKPGSAAQAGAAAARAPRVSQPAASARPARPQLAERDRDLEDLQVQRAYGGSIPGYDEGGPVWEPPDYSGTRLPAAAAAQIAEQLEQPSSAGSVPTAKLAAMAAPGAPAGVPMDLAARQGGNPFDPAAHALSTIPGLRLRQQPAALRPEERPAPTAVSPAPRPVGGRAGSRAADDFAQATKDEQAALLERGAAEAQQATETARVLGQSRRTLEQAAIEQREQQTRARSEASEMMGQYRQQLDELRKTDASVDPGRFWASRTTGQKVLGVIGLALGAVGAGKDGINRAAQMLSTAIDRDVEAQKAEAEARLRKGGQALAGVQQMYAMNRQLFQDDIAATAAAKATGLEIADNQLRQVAATAASPIAKANAAALSAQLRQAKAKFDAELQQRAAELGLKREALRIDEEKVGASLLKGAPPPKNAELAKGAHEAADELEQEFLTNPTSPRIGQLRASLMLHLNKLQGGRFNEEIHAMNQALIPGNEGASAWQRAQGAIAPEMVKRKFEILRKHIDATANTPPNPSFEAAP